MGPNGLIAEFLLHLNLDLKVIIYIYFIHNPFCIIIQLAIESDGEKICD